MRKYQVKIDDTESSQQFTLDELLELGLLDDYDENIKVRSVGEAAWHVAREYPFHKSEAAATSDVCTVNDDGTVTRKKPAPDRRCSIDEFGQIVRPGYTPPAASSPSPTSSSSSTPSPSSSSDDDNNGCAWIIAIIVGIGILTSIFG